MAQQERDIQIMQPDEPITIKRYAGQRLYHPGLAAYVTLDDIAAMVEDDETFVVHDAETDADVSRSVLEQIIVKCGSHG